MIQDGLTLQVKGQSLTSEINLLPYGFPTASAGRVTVGDDKLTIDAANGNTDASGWQYALPPPFARVRALRNHPRVRTALVSCARRQS